MNSRAPINAPLHQKHSVSGQPTPQSQANSGIYTYFLVPYSLSIFLILVLYSSSYKSFLPSVPFCNSRGPWEWRLPASCGVESLYHPHCRLQSFLTPSCTCFTSVINLGLSPPRSLGTNASHKSPASSCLSCHFSAYEWAFLNFVPVLPPLLLSTALLFAFLFPPAPPPCHHFSMTDKVARVLYLPSIPPTPLKSCSGSWEANSQKLGEPSKLWLPCPVPAAQKMLSHFYRLASFCCIWCDPPHEICIW